MGPDEDRPGEDEGGEGRRQKKKEKKEKKERPWFLDPRALVAFLGALVALILGVISPA